MKLSLIVPAYNEESRIGDMLSVYLPVLEAAYGHQFEMLVVINGTTDRTEAVVRSYIAQFPQLRVLSNPDPIGKGGAVMWGFDEAVGDWIGFADADGATPPSAFLKLTEDIEGAGAVIASRWIKGAEVSPRQPLSRRLASRAFNFAVRTLFGIPVHDTQCGAKLLTREAWESIREKMGLTQWAFDVDMLFQLKRAGFRIVEQASVWHDVSGSKLDVGRASTQMAIAITRLRLLYSPFRFVVTAYDRLLGRYTPAVTSMAGSRLLQDSVILMVASLIANGVNFSQNIVMMNVMGERGDYPQYAALLSMIGIAGLPVTALMQLVAHRTALYLKEGAPGKIRPLFARVLRDTVLVSVVFVLIAGFNAGWLAEQVNVGESSLVILTALIIGLSALMPVMGGGLQGIQAFYWMSFVGIVWAVSRLAIGAGLVLPGGGVSGALVGQLIAVLVHLVVCGWALRPYLAKRKEGARGHEGPLYGYFAKSGIILGCFSGIFMLDSIVFNKYFDGDVKETYSRIGVLARSVVYLTMPIAWALFPKVVSKGGSDDESGRALGFGLAMVAVISIVTAFGCWILSPFVANTIIGSDAPETVMQLRAFILAMSPLSLVYIVVTFEIAQHRFAVMFPVVIGFIAYLVGLRLYHGSFMEVCLVLGTVSVLTMLGSIAILPWVRFRRGAASGVSA